GHRAALRGGAPLRPVEARGVPAREFPGRHRAHVLRRAGRARLPPRARGDRAAIRVVRWLTTRPARTARMARTARTAADRTGPMRRNWNSSATRSTRWTARSWA